MGDPISTTALAAISIGASAASTAMTAVSAGQQAKAEFKAAEAQRKAEEQEALRGIAQEQQESLDQQSDIMRSSQKELGAVQASETMLSQTSLGSLLYAGEYDLNVGLGRVAEQETRDVGFKKSQQAAAIAGQNTRNIQASGRAAGQISKAVGSTLKTAVGVGMSAYGADKTPGKGNSSFFADSFN